jgi:drug/metabolite transporter (DMT)-like permease
MPSPMALRISQPVPLRAAGIAAAAVGAFIIESSAAHRPMAVSGLVLVAFGISVLDGVGRRRLDSRQLGLFVAIIGGSLAAWAAAVLAVLAVFALPAGGHVWALLWSGLAGGILGVVLLRRWSVFGPIRSLDAPDIQVGSDSAKQTGRAA